MSSIVYTARAFIFMMVLAGGVLAGCDSGNEDGGGNGGDPPDDSGGGPVVLEVTEGGETRSFEVRAYAALDEDSVFRAFYFTESDRSDFQGDFVALDYGPPGGLTTGTFTLGDADGDDFIGYYRGRDEDVYLFPLSSGQVRLSAVEGDSIRGSFSFRSGADVVQARSFTAPVTTEIAFGPGPISGSERCVAFLTARPPFQVGEPVAFQDATPPTTSSQVNCLRDLDGARLTVRTSGTRPGTYPAYISYEEGDLRYEGDALPGGFLRIRSAFPERLTGDFEGPVVNVDNPGDTLFIRDGMFVVDP